MTVDPCSRPPAEVPPIQEFDTDAAFFAALTTEMELCTSDFTGWADITALDPGSDGAGPSVLARVRSDGRLVRVPVEVLVDIREGHCVRVDRVRATIDAQGWDENA